MTFSENQIGLLKAPLNAKNVKTRSQSGRTFSYVEAWHAIDEANRIFGFDAWTRETVEMRLVAEKPREVGQYKKPGWGVTYLAKVRVTVGGTMREGTGAGSGVDVDLGQAHESAAKEAESDAMKRALMTFGYTFGLALYDKDQANVVDEPEPPKDTNEHMARVVEKNNPGVTNAREWINEHLKKLKSSRDGAVFMSNLAVCTEEWTRIRIRYPNEWGSKTGAGLYGEGRKIATKFQCLTEFDDFIVQIEAAAQDEINQQKAG